MKIEWVEKHSFELDDYTLKYLAEHMEEYAKPYGWNLVEHSLEEWLGSDNIDRCNVSQYIENWDELVAKVTAEVEKYKS